MTGEITIRQAGAGDLDTIVAFNRSLALETEGLELDAAVLRTGVRKLLVNTDLGPYFLAERGDGVVGQCMVTTEWSDWRNGWLWWFQSVYVHRDHRRSGVFRALFRHVETLAAGQGDVCGLRLYVENANQRAMETYADLGMSPAGYIVYEKAIDREGLRATGGT